MKTFYSVVVLFVIGIAAVTTSIADDQASTEKKTDTLTGVVNKAPEVSFCMDGAAHTLVSSENGRTNATRLKSKTEDVKKQLDQLIGAHVTVSGRKNVGVECKAFEVSSVVKTEVPAKPK